MDSSCFNCWLNITQILGGKNLLSFLSLVHIYSKDSPSRTNGNFNVNWISHSLPRATHLHKHTWACRFVMSHFRAQQKVSIMGQNDNLWSLQYFTERCRSLEPSIGLICKWTKCVLPTWNFPHYALWMYHPEISSNTLTISLA